MKAYQLFKAEIMSALASTVLGKEAPGSSRSLRDGTIAKPGRYVAAFLMIGVSALAVGTVFTGLTYGFWQCFLVLSLASVLFYCGQRLAWLTYDSEIMTRED